MPTDQLSINDLHRGDVFLYHGSSFVSRMIRLFDGGDYSHASIYEGEGNVVEALFSGLTRQGVAPSVQGSLPVDVFRYVDQKGNTLGDPALPTDPINHEIDTYMARAHQYAYQDILLLALLASTRRLPIGWVPGLAPILRNIFDSAAEVVSDLIAQKREPLICSEFVYRVYNEADPTGKYKILVVGSDSVGTLSAGSLATSGPLLSTMATPGPTGTDPATIDDLQRHAQSFLQSYVIALNVNSHEEVSTLAVANFVTPHDLQLSPNLHFIGTISI